MQINIFKAPMNIRIGTLPLVNSTDSNTSILNNKLKLSVK